MINCSRVKITAPAALVLLASIGAAQEPQGAAPPAPQTTPRQTGGAPPSDDATRMGSPPRLPEGMTEPQMWPAATAEGWKKPVLISWQRSFDDAVRVSRATGKPILVAVNMDGEIASEHYAGVRYRESETAKLFEPYVCVVASVYRHTPRDYDEKGRRVHCPRLGAITCGEHIAAETELYEKYFDGIRVSPRHIALELDGKEMYDVYFSWDTQTVFTALVKGVENRPPPRPLDHDMPLAERTKSPDVIDRTSIEIEYEKGTPEVRRTLLQAVLTRREVDQVDLLRLAIFGLDLDHARMARQALARCETEGAVDLIAEALKVPLAAEERAMLIEASQRLGQKFPRARTLTAVHQGLAQGSKWVDARRATEQEYESQMRTPAPSLDARAADAEARPKDASSRLDLAKALLARAEDPATERRYVALLVEDARRAIDEAKALGASGFKLDLVLAVSDALSGDDASARKHAVAAVEGGMLMPGTTADNVLERTELRVLALFASARQRAIREAYRAGSSWPPEWLSDINAAYAVLAKHPLGSDEHLVSFYDFLRWLGGTARANAILDDAIARFPASALVHDRLRARILWESGPDGLEAGYAARLAQDSSNADLVWFAGYASLVAAEHHRREGDVDKALSSYARGIAHYERFAAERPDGRDNAQHFIALAVAGRARIALERGDLELATQEILASFERAPAAGATPDGLNITPVDTAKMLSAKLEEAPNAELLAKLQAGLGALDPKLLEKRPFELENPRPRRERRGDGRDTPR